MEWRASETLDMSADLGGRGEGAWAWGHRWEGAHLLLQLRLGFGLRLWILAPAALAAGLLLCLLHVGLHTGCKRQERVTGAQPFPGHLSPPWPTHPVLTCFTLSLCGIGLGTPGHESADGEEAAASLASTDQDGPIMRIRFPGLSGVLLQLLLEAKMWGSGQGRGRRRAALEALM